MGLELSKNTFDKARDAAMKPSMVAKFGVELLTKDQIDTAMEVGKQTGNKLGVLKDTVVDEAKKVLAQPEVENVVNGTREKLGSLATTVAQNPGVQAAIPPTFKMAWNRLGKKK